MFNSSTEEGAHLSAFVNFIQAILTIIVTMGSLFKRRSDALNKSFSDIFIDAPITSDHVNSYSTSTITERLCTSDLYSNYRQPPKLPEIDLSGCSIPEVNVDEKLDYLGEGTYGDVFKGQYNEKEVAIKIYKSNQWQSLSQEIELIKQIMTWQKDHTKITGIIYFYGVTPKYNIVMEYAAHGSLEGRIFENKEISWTQTYRILGDAARGLEFLHTYNVIHRDVKPENILIVDENGQERGKLADFNLSGEPNKKLFLGTPVFAAPEVLSMEGQDLPADVFSFGMTVWSVQQRQLPYEEYTEIHDIVSHVVIEKKRLDIAADCPEKVAHWIQRCWEHDPKERPTASQLALELEEEAGKADVPQLKGP